MKICIVSSVPGHDAELSRVCEALQMYDQMFCNQPVDPFSGESFTPAQFRVLAKGEPVPTDEIPYHIDATTGVEDAAAYHDKYGDGRPYAIAGLDSAKGGEWLCADGDSVLALLEHEHAELRGNPKINRWVQSNFLDKSTGKTYPLVCPERADPFQGVCDKMKLSDGTMVDRVAFAYLAFFDRDRIQCEQLDSHGAASEPLVILPGGYQIVASIGRESQVFGMRSTKAGRVEVCEHHSVKMTAAKRARKLSPASRTMRIVNSLL